VTVAKDAKEFVDVWYAELNRTSMLWNSLPEEETKRFREFLEEYKGFIGIAAVHTYSKEQIIEALNSGIDPEVFGAKEANPNCPKCGGESDELKVGEAIDDMGTYICKGCGCAFTKDDVDNKELREQLEVEATGKEGSTIVQGAVKKPCWHYPRGLCKHNDPNNCSHEGILCPKDTVKITTTGVKGAGMTHGAVKFWGKDR